MTISKERHNEFEKMIKSFNISLEGFDLDGDIYQQIADRLNVSRQSIKRAIYVKLYSTPLK